MTEQFIEVLVTMVEAKFGLFQMTQGRVFGDSFELLETGFGKAPEGLDTVDVGGTLNELVLAVADPEVAVEAHIHQAVIAAPAVGVDHGRHVDFAPNNVLQRFFRAVRDDFGVHLAAAFEQAEDDGFAARAPAPFAAHPPRAEVALVEFDGPVQLGRHRAPSQQAAAQAPVQRVDRTHAQTRESGRVGGRQIQGKKAQHVAEFGLRNFCVIVIAVSRLHNRKLHHLFTRFAS